VSRRLAADLPESNRRWSFDLLSFRDQVLGRTRQGMPLLAVAAAAVLLIEAAAGVVLLGARFEAFEVEELEARE